jgi:hypothetical protein
MLKRKHKNIPLKAPENLWLQKSFEFVIPRSLEDCCSHLEQLHDGFFSGYNGVYLSSIDQKQIAFHISKSAGKSGSVWAVGYLQSEDTRATKIVGKTGIPAFNILLIVFSFAIASLVLRLDTILSQNVESICIIGFVIVLIGFVPWVVLIWSRESLIDDLKWIG